MSDHAGEYSAVLELMQDISKAQDANSLLAAVALVFVGIDTMAWLSLPKKGSVQTGRDFRRWVNRYLKADPDHVYQYDGKDVYAARCALLHRYGSSSDEKKSRKYGYIDSGPHQVADNKNLVLISVAQLTFDFGSAVTSFMKEASVNPGLKAKIDSRIPKLMRTISIQKL